MRTVLHVRSSQLKSHGGLTRARVCLLICGHADSRRWRDPPRPGRDAEQMSGIRGKDSGRLSVCAFAEVIHCGDADRAGWTCAEEPAEMGLGGFEYPNQKQMFSWYLLIKGKA